LFSIDFFVCFFLFFVSLSARLRENGWTDLPEIFREAVEQPWDDLITVLGQFRETARCRDANFFVSICQHYQQSALLAVMCCHLATENVVNVSTSEHGGGVCCAFAPRSLFHRVFVLLLQQFF